MRKLVTTIDNEKIEVIVENNKITMNDKQYEIVKQGNLTYVTGNGDLIPIEDVVDQKNGSFRVEIKGYTIDVKVENPLDAMVRGSVDNPDMVIAPLTGVVSNIYVKVGDEVQDDTILLTISAMKMENKILSKTNGRVKSININIGDQVKTGSTLIEFEKV